LKIVSKLGSTSDKIPFAMFIGSIEGVWRRVVSSENERHWDEVTLDSLAVVLLKFTEVTLFLTKNVLFPASVRRKSHVECGTDHKFNHVHGMTRRNRDSVMSLDKLKEWKHMAIINTIR
jgi:hypothetical protein